MVGTDSLNVIHRCAAGLDVHKMQITATVLIARADAEAQTHTQQFEALPEGLEKLSNWLLGFGVTAAAMEATGIYWLSVYETLEKAGIRPLVFNAQHVKQIKGRKTDVADSLWLARICSFGLGAPSFVPPAAFRDLRDLSHKRRKIAQDRSRLRIRVHDPRPRRHPCRRYPLGPVRGQRDAAPRGACRRDAARPDHRGPVRTCPLTPGRFARCAER